MAIRIVEANADRLFLKEPVFSRVLQGLLLAAVGSAIIAFFILFAVAFAPFFYGFCLFGVWIAYVGVYGLAGSRSVTADRWANELQIEHLLKFLLIPHSIKVNFGDVEEVQLRQIAQTEKGPYSQQEFFSVALSVSSGDIILIWTYNDRGIAVETSNSIALFMDKPVLLIKD